MVHLCMIDRLNMVLVQSYVTHFPEGLDLSLLNSWNVASHEQGGPTTQLGASDAHCLQPLFPRIRLETPHNCHLVSISENEPLRSK